jgi:hypothetical protein
MKKDKKELKEIIKQGIIKSDYVFTNDELEKLVDSIANEVINYQKKLNPKK